ncbi:amidohydrolase-like protein 3 [Penicillium subrubescens]|uniref:N-substituted formamide deformylase n=1 Tax=Penicillium subrubescens TaxID=1316194 RepID=A0A1Q5TL30_9EURO|nr:amidohydrolase-like protein 3 [Penicillium subrubescens]KAJ5906766.1 amidohydrolase-like protein 3 [Penicillium subrubescens]OKP00926.1 N-substituted formamide deformylase [Penicillium subrubescens]
MLSSTGPNNSVAYYNGHVYTVNPAQPWAQAFIVSPTGIIEAIGTEEGIFKIASSRNLIRYDLAQRFVMPGIHDAHTHLLLASMQALNESSIGFDSGASNISQRLEDGICACAYHNVAGDWVIGNFYQASFFPDGIPDRKYLDSKYPTTPVLVREVSCHRILLNTAGMKRAGIDPVHAVDPPGGFYVRRSDGSLTGEVAESAMSQVFSKLPITPLSHAKRALEFGVRMCLKYGITSCQEASANSLYLHAVEELEQENRLDLDIYTHIVCAPETFAMEPRDSLAALLDVANGFRSKHVHTNFVKFWLDGAPLPPQFTQCDLDAQGRPEQKHMVIDWRFLEEAVTKYDARGMTCKLHVAGEGSARGALDVLERVRKANPNGPRHELAHCSAVHEDDVPRFAKNRITAEMSPAIFHEPVVQEIPHLLKWPFNHVLETGAHMTIGSDWLLPETPSLFDALAAIVEKVEIWPGGRKSSALESGKSKKERGGEILCRVITLSGAEAVGAQDQTGSLEVGKRANFIAVDRDLSKGNFSGATVLKTWFEGRLVYDRKDHDSVAIPSTANSRL